MGKRSLFAIAAAAFAAACGFALTACDSGEAEDPPSGHVHRWSDDWVNSDPDYHWRVCLDCDETAYKAPHIYEYGKCVCGKTESEEIPPESHKHSFGDWENYDDEFHRRNCEGCDLYESSKHEWYTDFYLPFDDEFHKIECEQCEGYKLLKHNFDDDNICDDCGVASKDFYYVLSSDGTYYTLDSVGLFEGTEAVIPAIHKDKPVKKIGDQAFAVCNKITKVVIRDGVEEIGMRAFAYCSGLESVDIPASVTRVSSDAFIGRRAAQKIYYGGSIEQWCGIDCGEYNGFYNGRERNNNYDLYIDGKIVADLEIPSNVTQIKSNAFADCGSIRNVNVPNTVTEICEGAFAGCENIASMTLPFVGSSVKSAADSFQYPLGYIFGQLYGGIGTTQMFEGGDIADSTHTSYNIPSTLESVTVTGGTVLYGAFSNCTGLSKIVITEAVRGVGLFATMGCDALKYNEYKNGLYLGDDANPYRALIKVKDSTVTSFEINKDTRIIADGAFSDCNNMQYTRYNNGLYLGDGQNEHAVFVKADNAEITSCTVSDTAKFICDNAFEYCNALTAVSVPDGVVSIGRGALKNCGVLADISIGRGVKYIGSRFITERTALKNISVSADNPYYKSAGNCLIEVGNKTLVTGCKNSVVPSDGSVANIGIYAFENCGGLVSANVPDCIVSIGFMAYGDCPDLKRVTIGAGITQEKLRELFFFPLRSSEKLEYFEVSADNPVYSGAGGIIYNKAQTRVVLAPYAVKGVVTVADGVTDIGSRAFSDCKEVTCVELPSSLNQIEYKAFTECTGLTTIKFGGTRSEWLAVKKGDHWDFNMPSYTVICADD